MPRTPFFAPQWQKEDCAPLRKKTIERWKSQTTPYSPFSIIRPGKRTDIYEHVKILPLVHGTRAATCNSICDIGFTFFGKHSLIHGEQELGSNTDLGYFGSGIYFTNSVRYATLDCYSDGNFFIGWVVMPEPYPVVANAPYDTSGNPKPKDMQKLEGLNAYEKYKAHYIPVAPIDPSQKMCCMYYPCATGQEPWVDEFAIFDSAQTLVRFWIELQIDLPKSIGDPQSTVGALLQKVLDLLEEQAILQDKEAYSMLETKYEVLITRNPAKNLSSSDQIFFNQISQLLDTNGKVRGYVRNKLAGPQSSPISESKSLTQSNVTYPIVISTKSHSSNPFSISTATNNSAATTILPQIVQPNYLPNTYPNPTYNSTPYGYNSNYPIASSTNSHFSNPLPPYIIRELPPIPTLSTSKPLTIHDSSPIQPQKSCSSYSSINSFRSRCLEEAFRRRWSRTSASSRHQSNPLFSLPVLAE